RTSFAVSRGSGVTRGGRRGNERVARLREVVPAINAVAGGGLGGRKPALLAGHCGPVEPGGWLAALGAVLGGGGPAAGARVGCRGLAAVAQMGYRAFAASVRERLAGWGGQRRGPAASRVFAGLAAAGGVARMLRAALRRIGGALADLRHARARRGRLEAQMAGLLDAVGIDHARICQIPGLTVAGLAAILAKTGDLRQYASSSPAVKHARDVPGRNHSPAFCGQTKISRRGRPALRLTVWRATWAVLRHGDVLAAKHAARAS